MASYSPSTSSSVLQSSSERDFITAGCREDCRVDGRTRQEFRPYNLWVTSTPESNSNATTALPLLHGTARLTRNNDTGSDSLDLLASIKAEVVCPAVHQPDTGVLEIAVDTLLQPVMNRSAVKRRLEYLQSSLVTLLGDYLLDLKALCLVPGAAVWRIQADVMVVAGSLFAGNLLGACATVLEAALQGTRLPAVTAEQKQGIATNNNSNTTAIPGNAVMPELLVDGDMQHAVPLDGVDDAPVLVTVTLLKSSTQSSSSSQSPYTLIVDATAQEEACAAAQVHVALQASSDNKQSDDVVVCGLALAGPGSVPVGLLPACVAQAQAALGPRRKALHVAPMTTQQVTLPALYTLQ